MSEMKTARLENWLYTGRFLYGNVYNHHRCADGLWVMTTEVASFDPAAKTAVTQNTRYELGKPAEEIGHAEAHH